MSFDYVTTPVTYVLFIEHLEYCSNIPLDLSAFIYDTYAILLYYAFGFAYPRINYNWQPCCQVLYELYRSAHLFCQRGFDKCNTYICIGQPLRDINRWYCHNQKIIRINIVTPEFLHNELFSFIRNIQEETWNFPLETFEEINHLIYQVPV